MSKFIQINFLAADPNVKITILNRCGDEVPHIKRDVCKRLIPSPNDEVAVSLKTIKLEDLPKEDLTKVFKLTYTFNYDDFAYKRGVPCIETSGRSLGLSNPEIFRDTTDKSTDYHNLFIANGEELSNYDLTPFSFNKFEMIGQVKNHYAEVQTFNENLDLVSKRLIIRNGFTGMEIPDEYEEVFFRGPIDDRFKTVCRRVKTLKYIHYDERTFERFPNVEKLICHRHEILKDSIKPIVEQLKVQMPDPYTLTRSNTKEIEKVFDFKCKELSIVPLTHDKQSRKTYRLLEYLKISDKVIFENVTLSSKSNKLKNLTILVEKQDN